MTLDLDAIFYHEAPSSWTTRLSPSTQSRRQTSFQKDKPRDKVHREEWSGSDPQRSCGIGFPPCVTSSVNQIQPCVHTTSRKMSLCHWNLELVYSQARGTKSDWELILKHISHSLDFLDREGLEFLTLVLQTFSLFFSSPYQKIFWKSATSDFFAHFSQTNAGSAFLT